MIIVDIDGTLSRVGDRVNCLLQEPKDWDGFYSRCGEDLPKTAIINLVHMHWYFWDHEIVLCTGRRESSRKDTVVWLTEHTVLDRCLLLMRPDDDFRHDTTLKPELISKAGILVDDVDFILEDRSSMVKKWRELGFTCLQVAEGDF